MAARGVVSGGAEMVGKGGSEGRGELLALRCLLQGEAPATVQPKRALRQLQWSQWGLN